MPRKGRYVAGDNRTHGMSRTPTHRCWTGMMTRCSNPRVPEFKNYGGRGITVCDRWRDFANFLADMGVRPSPTHSLDRFPNNDGNYEPCNCRWATRVEQSRNTRTALKFVTLDGEQMSGMDMARFLALPRSTFFRWFHRTEAVAS